jgi:hypothetical protein
MDYEQQNEVESHESYSEYESDEESQYSESTLSTHSGKKKVALFNVDKDRFKIKTNTYKVNGYDVVNSPGVKIRNAVTGYYEYTSSNDKTCRVGSLHEHCFFTMKLSINGYNRDGRLLFYDNPEQCERHLRIKIDKNIKKKWKDKYNAHKSIF